MMKSSDKGGEVAGLDIGTYSIKVAVLKNILGVKTLTVLSEKKISPESDLNEKTNIIKKMFEELNFRPREVNLSISGPGVVVRFVNFPKMSRQELENALVYETEKYIPFNINEVVTDFVISEGVSETGQMRVILAAAKKNSIEDLIKVCGDLGLTIGIIDTDPFAVFNAFWEGKPSLEEKTYALINFGHSRSDLLVSTGKEPSFIRQIQFAGKNIAEAISRDLSIRPEEAEKYKLDPVSEESERVLRSTCSVLDDLVKEIQLSFSYFENRQGKNISEVYCSGGMIEQEGVFEYLNKNLKVQMKKWNPMENLAIAEHLSPEYVSSAASRFAVCAGLALRKE